MLQVASCTQLRKTIVQETTKNRNLIEHVISWQAVALWVEHVFLLHDILLVSYMAFAPGAALWRSSDSAGI